jgi:hypothetical protein
MLASDLGAPRKQRHTAHRIWTRIRRIRSAKPVSGGMWRSASAISA